MKIDTSREAVERLLDGVTEGPWAWPTPVSSPPRVTLCPPYWPSVTKQTAVLAAEERGIQIGLRAAVQSLRTWQASLVQHRMSETAITVGMSVDVVLILTPDEARKMGEL